MRLVPFLALLAACGATPPAAPPEGEPAIAAAPTGEGHHDPAPAAAGETHFGAPFAVAETTTAAALLADPSPFVGKTLKVEGRVADVCQKAGCWMVIADQDKVMRVRMKDHGFSVAKDATGTTALVEGVIVEKAMDPEEAAHFAGEAAKPEVAPEAKAAAAGKLYEIEATAVEIKKS